MPYYLQEYLKEKEILTPYFCISLISGFVEEFIVLLFHLTHTIGKL